MLLPTSTSSPSLPYTDDGSAYLCVALTVLEYFGLVVFIGEVPGHAQEAMGCQGTEVKTMIDNFRTECLTAELMTAFEKKGCGTPP